MAGCGGRREANDGKHVAASRSPDLSLDEGKDKARRMGVSWGNSAASTGESSTSCHLTIPSRDSAAFVRVKGWTGMPSRDSRPVAAFTAATGTCETPSGGVRALSPGRDQHLSMDGQRVCQGYATPLRATQSLKGSRSEGVSVWVRSCKQLEGVGVANPGVVWEAFVGRSGSIDGAVGHDRFCALARSEGAVSPRGVNRDLLMATSADLPLCCPAIGLPSVLPSASLGRFNSVAKGDVVSRRPHSLAGRVLRTTPRETCGATGIGSGPGRALG